MGERIPKVLIVDDEPDMCEVLSHYVEAAGFEAASCPDGEEALRRLDASDFDMVCSDLKMPKLDGLGLLAALNARGSKRPFILLTGFGSQELARRALRMGAFDFVDKPFETGHLLSTLKGAAVLSQQIMSSSEALHVIPSQWHVDFANLVLQCDTSAETRQKFIDQSLDQLTFCKASVKNLKDQKTRKMELAYLIRVMRSFTFGAQQCGFLDLSVFTAMMTECLIYYRSRPERLLDEHIPLLNEVVHVLLKYLKVVDNQRSVQHLLLRLGEKIDQLGQSLGKVHEPVARSA